jgi:hypothetical protein
MTELQWRCLRCSRMLPFSAYKRAGTGLMRVCAECWQKRVAERRLSKMIAWPAEAPTEGE